MARRTVANRAVPPVKQRGSIRARPARAPAQPPATPPETVRKVDEDSFEVDRDDVEDLVRNPTTLFSQARIIPKYDEGEMIGLQVNGIKSGSLFEEIGLQSGDVITKLNGIVIDDPQESAKVLSEFAEAESFTVDIERGDGSVDTLEFNLGAGE
jgi:general secretion pathway protein C